MMEWHGYILVGEAKRPGWRGFLPIFLVRCPVGHGLFLDYLHGFPGEEKFYCPMCFQEKSALFEEPLRS